MCVSVRLIRGDLKETVAETDPRAGAVRSTRMQTEEAKPFQAWPLSSMYRNTDNR